MKVEEIRNKLIEKGLRVTPQRIAILKAMMYLKNHPTADQIFESIRKSNPNISPATVYKVLDAFVSAGLIKTVKTDFDIKRYDAISGKHHHLYFTDSDIIKDYEDEELNALLENYFKNKFIPDFQIEDLRLQIIGKKIKGK